MFSRSLYLSGSADPVQNLAKVLCIRAENCFAESSPPGDYSFFAREENSLVYSPVEGAFQVAVDVHLFHVDWPEFEAQLLKTSTAGMVLAVPAEDSDNPFDFLLYENGSRSTIQVIEDEEGGRLEIWRRD